MDVDGVRSSVPGRLGLGTPPVEPGKNLASLLALLRVFLVSFKLISPGIAFLVHPSSASLVHPRNLSNSARNLDDTLKDSRGHDPPFVSRSIMLGVLETHRCIVRSRRNDIISRGTHDAFMGTPEDPWSGAGGGRISV